MPTHPAHQLSNLLRQVTIAEQHYFIQESKDLPVTEQQARTLGYIAHNPGIIQRELAEAFHRRGASISSMLKNLERDGYIVRRRDPDNDRNKSIYLTEKGQTITKSFDVIFERTEARLVANLTPDEVARATAILNKIKFDH